MLYHQPKHISFDIRTFVVVLQISSQLSIVESVVVIFVRFTMCACKALLLFLFFSGNAVVSL